MQKDNILIWLPSPMGDAVLATPALRAIRNHYPDSSIYFYANKIVKEVLSPCRFNDYWLAQDTNCPFKTARKFKNYKFKQAILLKNSFSSALAIFLAGIESRVGYARDCRSLLLTEKLYPPKLATGKFKPQSMVKYYLAPAIWLGCDIQDDQLELSTDPQSAQSLKEKLPQIYSTDKPLFILVPGGAFGPSKCWPAQYFAKIADQLIEKYNANVVISVSPSPQEIKIASNIIASSKNNLIDISQAKLSLSQLKALFEKASLVIANDTGPRHIAIALKRKIVTLFGPNDPVWTDTGYENEIQIVTNVPCAPCQKPKCPTKNHICMKAISVERVFSAASKLLEGDK